VSGDVSRDDLRRTFDEVPELYDRARPRYPREVLDDLVALTGLAPGDRIVEIGPGTGQATLPLAEHGLEIVGLEPGAGLAAVARRNVVAYPRVQIVEATFEDWEPGEAQFDAVVAFTAFHWIDPEIRYQRSAQLLRPGGRLAVVATDHVLPADGDSFFADVQQDYVSLTDEEDTSPPSDPADIPDMSAEIDASGLFGTVAVRRYVWDVTYTADSYLELLDTFSGHRSLPEDVRLRLYAAIRARIERQPEQKVRKTSIAILHVARARAT
jgi:SAM-dependent methyltransferase